MLDESPTLPKNWLLFLFVSLVASPITALVSAKILSTLWNLLLASQYGSGPSYQSWYGVSLLLGYLSWSWRKKDDKEQTKLSIVDATIDSVAMWMYGGILIIAAGLVRVVVGWH